MAVLGEEGVPVKELPIIGEWIVEAEEKARSEGETEGERKGKTEEAREMALVALRERFGELPESIVGRVNRADRQTCREVVQGVLKGWPLDELDRMIG